MVLLGNLQLRVLSNVPCRKSELNGRALQGKDQFGEPINQGFESPPPQRKPRTKTFTKPSALQVQCVPLHLLHYFEHSNLARLHGGQTWNCFVTLMTVMTVMTVAGLCLGLC